MSGTHFCWFDDSTAVVGVPGSGTVFTHVTSSTLTGLFPEVTTLRIIEVVANSTTEVLYILVGDGLSGIGLLEVPDNGGTPTIIAEGEDFESTLRVTFDLVDVGIVSDERPFVVDANSGNLLTFPSVDNPFVFLPSVDLEVATGGTSVDVALTVHISTGSAGDGVIVFEADSESLVLVVE